MILNARRLLRIFEKLQAGHIADRDRLPPATGRRAYALI
jgi:hypothetical protein